MKSQELKQQAQQAESDFEYMSLMKKSLREARLEKFEQYVIDIERKGYDISYANYKFTIDTDAQSEKFGVIDFFPKANKVLMRNENTWVKPGLNWIIKNLL